LSSLSPPPPDFGKRRLPTLTLGPSVYFRCFELKYPPIRVSADPAHRCTVAGGGTAYFSDAPHCAYIEAVPLLPHPVLPAFGPTERWLEQHGVAEIRICRTLRVVDLTGSGLARLGIDNAFSTCPHPEAQRWAQVIFDHPSKVEGILFRSRVDPECRNLAAFDRAEDAFKIEVRHTFVSSPSLWLGMLRRYEHVILPDDEPVGDEEDS
jgi:hypothetical protein